MRRALVLTLCSAVLILLLVKAAHSANSQNRSQNHKNLVDRSDINQSTQSTIAQPIETLYLETRLNGRNNPVIGTQSLEIDKLYVIQVIGTWSPWYASRWSSYCGPAEDSPTIPSPGIQNGKVGVDAAYTFAAPSNSGWCPLPEPKRWRGFEISLDGGASWLKIDPIGNAYREDHVYDYEVTGLGFVPRFRILDDYYITDNYGILTIDILRITNTSNFVGQGFDKCEIPTLSEMQIWMTSSPYKAVNLYIGGLRRSCPNTALTATYIKQLSLQGWKFIPTWVGPQCLYNDISNDPVLAYAQGADEANAAIKVASDLGLTTPSASGTIIYYDLEGYNNQNPNCRDSAKSFIEGWTAQLHATGNLAGVYGSSCASNIADFSEISIIPDAIWPAGGGFWSSQYDSKATVWGISCINDSVWSNHERIYQYTAGHSESWGNVALSIDSNVIDGIVGDLGMPYYQYLPVVTK